MVYCSTCTNGVQGAVLFIQQVLTAMAWPMYILIAYPHLFWYIRLCPISYTQIVDNHVDNFLAKEDILWIKMNYGKKHCL